METYTYYTFRGKYYPFDVNDPTERIPKYIRRVKGRLLRRAKWRPSVGDLVVACYDGKALRISFGVVQKVSHLKMTVKMIPWLSEGEPKESTLRAIRSYEGSFFGFLRGENELGIMRALGTSGDYYSFHPLSHLNILGEYDLKVESDVKSYTQVRTEIKEKMRYFKDAGAVDLLLDLATASAL